MPLHLIKLSVGSESIRDHEDWVKEKLAQKKKAGEKPEYMHRTRMVPKRAEEVLDGGSMYWVIKGQIAARQKLLELRPVTRDGVPHCALVLDKTLVPVERRNHRAFQGWRYLEAKDAPRDLKARDKKALPEALRAELTNLGLL